MPEPTTTVEGIPEDQQCVATTKAGNRCARPRVLDTEFCSVHAAPASASQAKRFAAVDGDNVPVHEADWSGGLCSVHFPLGWPDDAESAGCADGTYTR
jgi:hypothetical protein